MQKWSSSLDIGDGKKNETQGIIFFHRDRRNHNAPNRYIIQFFPYLFGKMRKIPLLLGFEYSCATANILPFLTPHQKKIKYYLVPKFSSAVKNTKLQFTVSCTLSPYHYF